MAIRKITKQLICVEDLNLGNGTESQTRSGAPYTVTKFTPQVIIDDIADLANVNEAKITCVFVQGFYDVNDGGGGVFIWDATADALTHDGGLIIDPNHSLIAAPGTSTWWTGEAGTGAWKRIYNGAPHAKWFGSAEDELSQTTAKLADQTADINTRGKAVGKMVYNTTTNKPVWADGTGATDVWVDATGSTAHTPV